MKVDYNRIAKKHYKISNSVKNYQINYKFPSNIKFSILVPLYNTPKKYLKKLIVSVVKQTYGNWELCLSDGSDSTHKYIQNYCEVLCLNEHRLVYRKLEDNLGISENTNKCIEMSSGDYFALLDHDDVLHPSALFEVMKAICDENADFIYTDESTFHKTPSDSYLPHYKPDYAIDTLRANNYICHFTVFSRKLFEITGGFRAEFDGSQDYDMVLRLTEKAKKIVHIPKILYYWRAHKGSVASNIEAKSYVIDAAKKALAEHLDRINLKGEVVDSSLISTYKINYEIKDCPLVSILIPNKDHVNDLKTCLTSIYTKSTYLNFEVIVIENNSTLRETFDYYDFLKMEDKVKIIHWDHDFNYSSINNFGFSLANGEHILLLNNDTEIITPNWIEEMLMFSQRNDVGVVGSKLYYPDDTIQHAGVGIGLIGLAGHLFRNFPRLHSGYMGRLTYAQNLSAVTGACMMIPRHVFEEVSGLDPLFEIAFNDIDLCMRIRRKGYLIVFTPYAELYHYESKSRGLDDTPDKIKRFSNEIRLFKQRWNIEIERGDPYYNRNLTLDKEDFTIKIR